MKNQKPKSTDQNFVAFQLSFFTRLQNLEVSPNMFCTYAQLLKQCDWETGIWWGSASKISHAWGSQISEGTIQKNLAALAKRGCIKSFHVQGSKRDYAIAIHNYVVRFGPYKGMMLDAIQTISPLKPAYVQPSATNIVEVVCTENGQDSVAHPPVTRRSPAGHPPVTHPKRG